MTLVSMVVMQNDRDFMEVIHQYPSRVCHRRNKGSDNAGQHTRQYDRMCNKHSCAVHTMGQNAIRLSVVTAQRRMQRYVSAVVVSHTEYSTGTAQKLPFRVNTKNVIKNVVTTSDSTVTFVS